MERLRVIPSIDRLRQREAIRRLETEYGAPSVVAALRESTTGLRTDLAAGTEVVGDAEDAARRIEADVRETLSHAYAPSLRPVINATGVIVHTNLGRAPLADRALRALSTIAGGYSNLEFDLERGGRGHRSAHATALLQRLTGAESAAVVNNNAAAILLTLAALGDGREVIISRGELVEIGGGFRIPDVLAQSGARLREVGTTNRTRAEDYAAAIGERTALILRVHPSNFRIEGFASRPSLQAVVEVGRRFDVPVVEDLGSGNLDALSRHPGYAGEPTVRDSVGSGVTVCCFSGDKLLGGPQAGLIVGARAALDTLARHPLMRALRADKLVYAALEATLLEHLAGRAPKTVPVTRMVATTVDELLERARRLVAGLPPHAEVTVTIREGASTIGGGTTPGLTLPTVVLDLALEGVSPAALERRLRSASPPVVGRVEHDRLLLDLRTVLPREDEALGRVLAGLRRDRDRRQG